VNVLIDHYRDLILSKGSSYAALKPHIQTTAENVNGIIKLMEESTGSIRRQSAETIFP
jgi:hypothetical protein